MNIEQAFIKSQTSDEIVEHISVRHNAPPEPGVKLDMELPSSYDSIIAKDIKRKTAISKSVNGWVSILESKEVNDYKMLLDISKNLRTEVVSIVCSDVIGACGFAEFKNGEIIDSHYYEDIDDIEGLLEGVMESKGIQIPLSLFREVATYKANKWTICSHKVCRDRLYTKY